MRLFEDEIVILKVYRLAMGNSSIFDYLWSRGQATDGDPLGWNEKYINFL